MSTGPLLVVDAPSALYRAFFALPKTITDGRGRAVNALLGTANLVLQAVERHAPRAVVLCIGQESARYRVNLYPPYHSARPPMPDELRRQFTAAPRLFDAFGWQTATSRTLEADDLLYSYARVEEEAGGSALILTGDRDLFQAVTHRVTVLYLRTGGEGPDQVGPEEVERRYGVPPSRVPDFIALRGDPSDGLPGAKGIGEKTAAELLRRHGSLDAAIAGALRERPAVRAALYGQAGQLGMFRDVATLRRVNVERPPDRPTDYRAAAAAARRRGLKRLAERLERTSETAGERR